MVNFNYKAQLPTESSNQMKATAPPPPSPPPSPPPPSSLASTDSNSFASPSPSPSPVISKSSRASRTEHLRGLKQQLKWPTRKPALVEVTSDEEGFRGAWYLATLLHLPFSTSPAPPSRRRQNSTHAQAQAHQAYVEYHNLVIEEGSEEPLREYVDVEFIRPSPPSTSPEEHFLVGDVVDAYVRDGWWTGVVTGAIPQELSFVVSFQNPSDEIVFGISDLRFHHQWANRQWVRPARQRVTGLIFSVGKRVEVSFDREDRRDAWFPATILENAGNGCYLVEHEIPKKGADGGPERVKATVDSLHLRPCPPSPKDSVFHLLDKVDAFFDFGWWSGMITKELANRHYLVYFQHNMKEKEFNCAHLRRHMEWKNGKWTLQVVPTHSDHYKNAGPICIDLADPEIRVTCNNTKEKMALSLNLNEVDSSDCYEEFPRISPSLENKIQDSPFASGSKVTSKGEMTIVNTEHAVTIESVDRMKLIECVDPSPKTAGNSVSNSSFDGDHSDSHTWGKSFKRKRSKHSEDDMVGSEGGSGGLKKLHMDCPSNPVGGIEGNALVDAAEVVKDGRITVSTNLPVILGLECDKGSNSTALKPCSLHNEEFLRHVGARGGVNDNELPRIKVRVSMNKMDPLEQNGDQLEPMRGRGQLLRGDTKSPVTSPSGDSTKDASMEELLVKSFLRCDNSLRDVKIKSASIDFLSQQFVINGGSKSKNSTHSLGPLKNLSDASVEVPIMVQNRRSSKRGKRRTVSVNAVSLAPVGKSDSPHTSAGKSTESNSTAEEMEIVSNELPAKLFDDQPLAKWIEEMHPPIDKDALEEPTTNVEQSALASNGLQQIVEESGQAQIVEDSSEPRVMEDSSQPQAMDDGSHTQAMDEGREPQAMEESCEPQAVEDSSQPQTMEGCQPPRVDESSKLFVEETLAVDEGSNLGNEFQALPSIKNYSDIAGNEVQTLPFVKSTGDCACNEVQVLPFVKKNSLWSTLEGMEVFKKLPQRPHFQPLEQYKESMREGLAIGYMVNFCGVVERTSKLQFDDSRSTIDDILDTLSELEGHGFNIQVLQDRVSDLVNMQDKEKELREEFEQLNGEMEKQNIERVKIDEEMEEINRHIMALQEKLLQTVSAKESKDREIASLKLKMDGIKENITRMESDFQHPIV